MPIHEASIASKQVSNQNAGALSAKAAPVTTSKEYEKKGNEKHLMMVIGQHDVHG